MKLKTLFIVVILLGVLSVAVHWRSRPTVEAVADDRIGQPVIPSSVVENAAKIKITDQGKSVLLVKQADGSWRVGSYYDMPADFAKLSTFVSELSAAKVEQFVTANPAKLDRLEFKDTQIQFLDTSGSPSQTVTLGKNAEAGGRFLRYNNEPKAYRANLNAWIEPDSKAWADPSLLTFKADDVAKLEIEFSGAPALILSRPAKTDDFAALNPPVAGKLKPEAVRSLLASLEGLRFTNTAELTDATVTSAKQNQRSVKVTTFAGATFSITLGRKPAEKIVKKPDPENDTKAGLAALRGMTSAATGSGNQGTPSGAAPAKITAPEIETIPAGPVFAFIQSSDAKAEINSLMTKRAFEIADYTFTGLPQTQAELFEVPQPQIDAKKSAAKP